MAKKAFRGFFRGVGRQLVHLEVGGVVGLIISIVGLIISTSAGSTPIPLNTILLWLGIGVASVVIAQILGYVFLRISKKIVLLAIRAVEDRAKSPRLLNLEIFNGYDEDFTDFRVELKRLTIIGHRIDAEIGNRKPFFFSGKRNEDNKIRAGDTATIHLIEIPKGDEDKFFVDFLTDPTWRGNYIFMDISGDSEERKKSIGVLAGVLYEFVIEISGKIENEYIIPQIYRGRIRYLSVDEKKDGWTPGIHWLRFDKYSMKEESKRPMFRPDEEMIRKRDDFWRMLNLLSQDKRKPKMKKDKKTKKQKTPSEKGVLTKNEFFKALDKVIGVVKPKPKSPAKGKSKTSE